MAKEEYVKYYKWETGSVTIQFPELHEAVYWKVHHHIKHGQCVTLNQGNTVSTS